MACFTCGESFSGDVISFLQKHKERFDKYGVKTVYYQKKTNGQIHIADAKDFFKTIKKNVFTKKSISEGANFALIQEFGHVENPIVLGDNKK